MRDDFLVVLDVQPHLIRAGVGVAEVIARPSINLAPRVGLRRDRDGGSVAKASDYLVGNALDQAETAGEHLDITWPLVYANELYSVDSEDHTGQNVNHHGDTEMIDASRKSATSKGKARKLDGCRDWKAFEAILRHILITELLLSSKPVNYMFLVALPPTFSSTGREELVRIFFETLGIANLKLVERAVVQLYSCASLTGVVVDIGQRSTDIAVVRETVLHSPSTLVSDIGEEDCDEYLAHILLQANPSLPELLAPPGQIAQSLQASITALRPIISALKEAEHLRYSAIVDGTRDSTPDEEDEGITDVAKAIATGKVNKLLSSNGHSNGIVELPEGDILLLPHPSDPTAEAIQIGPERHRYAEPLFNPRLLASVIDPNTNAKKDSCSLPETVAAAVQRLPVLEDRLDVWQSVVFTGGLARVKGLSGALIASLQPYATETSFLPKVQSALARAHAESENAAPVAPGSHRVRAKHQKTPDYFSEYRERPDLTSFLGGCIYAKLGFLESQGGEWITKQAYDQYGPKVATMFEP